MKNIYLLQKLLKHISLIILLMVIALVSESQNIAITDSAEYNAEASAMLDVMSTDKGMLVPRMTTEQRLLIVSPATGLLVYDTDNDGFFYFDGTDWLTISQMNTSGTGSALFAVLNATGDTVFAVYDDGAKVTVPFGSKGKVGGFAVSGRTSAKELFEDNYLYVTPDSTRVTFDEGAKGKVGGFAVSGRTSSKAGTSTTSLINLFPDNYFIGDSVGLDATGKYNNFFGYKAGAKNTTGFRNTFIGYQTGYSNLGGDYNVYLGEAAGHSGTYGNYNVFLGYKTGHNNPGSENTFVGCSAGELANSGTRNVLMGYEAGKNMNGGSNNVFIGTQSGKFFEAGDRNTFIGEGAGLNASGTHYNTVAIGYYSGSSIEADNSVFLGMWAGKLTTTGDHNTFIGHVAGQSNITGRYNLFMGAWTGSAFDKGKQNVFIGPYAGAGITDSISSSILIGYQAGYSLSTSERLYIENSASNSPLIYGEFDNDFVKINGDFEVTGNVTTGDLTVYAATGHSNLIIDGGVTTGTENRILFKENGATKVWFGYQTTLDYMFLYEGGTNSFVSKGGSIGLNTTTPSTYLHVNRNRDAVLATANTGVFMIGSSTGNNMVMDENEIMARSSGTTATTLHINREGGDIYLGNVSSEVFVPGTFTNASDIRLKEKVEPLTYGLSETLELNPVSFYWKDYKNLKKQVGFIAQELQKVLPELISETEDGYLSIDYIKIIPVVVNSIKEQQQQIDKQQEQINILIKELEELKK